jgi:hypothetical protein
MLRYRVLRGFGPQEIFADEEPEERCPSLVETGEPWLVGCAYRSVPGASRPDDYSESLRLTGSIPSGASLRRLSDEFR